MGGFAVDHGEFGVSNFAVPFRHFLRSFHIIASGGSICSPPENYAPRMASPKFAIHRPFLRIISQKIHFFLDFLRNMVYVKIEKVSGYKSDRFC